MFRHWVKTDNEKGKKVFAPLNCEAVVARSTELMKDRDRLTADLKRCNERLKNEDAKLQQLQRTSHTEREQKLLHIIAALKRDIEHLEIENDTVVCAFANA